MLTLRNSERLLAEVEATITLAICRADKAFRTTRLKSQDVLPSIEPVEGLAL